MNFKDYTEAVTLLETVYDELESAVLKNPSMKKWTELPAHKMMNPYMLLQTYIAALAAGVPHEDIIQKPSVMRRDPYKDKILEIFAGPLKNVYPEVVRNVFGADKVEDMINDVRLLDIESDEVQTIIQKLTDQFGSVDKNVETVATDI
jgi:hypothetical protein